MFDFWIANHLSTSMMSIIGWGILIGAVCYIYRTQTEKPVIWKMAIVVYIGLFCFNFQFPIGPSDTPMKIAILPLGVWILISLSTICVAGILLELCFSYYYFAYFSITKYFVSTR